jgi:urea carboxylase
MPDNGFAVDASLPGSVWKILVKPGETVEAGAPVMILESMKMELEVTTPKTGIVHSVLCKPGQTIEAGQAVLVMTHDEN